jgi:hypothetical protein
VDGSGDRAVFGSVSVKERNDELRERRCCFFLSLSSLLGNGAEGCTLHNRCLTTGFLGIDLKTHKVTVYDSGNVKFSTTMMATVGRAVANILLDAEKSANKYLYISSFEVSENEILASLESAMGKTFERTHVNSDDQIRIGREEMAVGNLGGMVKLLLSSIFKGGLGANFAEEATLSNEVLGLPKENLDDAIAGIVKGL